MGFRDWLNARAHEAEQEVARDMPVRSKLEFAEEHLVGEPELSYKCPYDFLCGGVRTGSKEMMAAHIVSRHANIVDNEIVSFMSPEPLNNQACRGDDKCPAPIHVHGCYADMGNCDDPDDHNTGLENVLRVVDEDRGGPTPPPPAQGWA